MASPQLQAEIDARFESDKKAFEGFSPREQKIAALMAGAGFGARQGAVGVGSLLINLTEGAFNLIVRAPLAFAWSMTTKLADNTANAPVRIATAAGRGGLSIVSAAVGLWGKGIELLHRAGLADDPRKKTAGTLDKLEEKRQKVALWGKLKQEKQAQDWRKKKRRFRSALAKTGEFLEYRGAIGLYRAFKWMLDPRRPSGKPLLGNEKINKAVGLIAAVAMFGILSFQLSKIIVLGKILHIKLAQSLVTNTAPLWIKALQQTVLHPAITIGLTAVKFVMLPVIAAARGRMKSTDFTQGIAYQYNTMLHEENENNLKREFNKQAKYAPKADDPKWKEFRNKAVTAASKKSLSFIRTFFRHIVEKSSPEFYEVRHRHYIDLFAERKKQKEERLAAKAAKAAKAAPVPAPAPEGPLAANAPTLATSFDAAKTPPIVPPAPPAANIQPPAPAV